MKIGIFPACLGRRDAGPETYERELIGNLTRLPQNHEFHVFFLTQAAAEAVKVSGGPIFQHTLWPAIRPLSMGLSLPLMLASYGVDLYHATFVSAPFSVTKSVFTMHDVSPFTRPEFYPEAIRRRLTLLIKRGLNQARLIICISENCRDTTQELFGIHRDRLVVVPHGVAQGFAPVDRSTARSRVTQCFGLTAPYILYVGKLEARKNIGRLLRAFHEFRIQTKSEVQLVLAGRRFWDLENIDRIIAELGLKNVVTELGYVPEQELSALYSGAELFVFPSLWEGFGFPVLEAMKCGTPVITSNVSCLPEVAGGAAELVDPTSVDQIGAAMTKMMSDATGRAENVKKGLLQAAKFTWENTARMTLAAYERAAAM